MEDLGQVTVKVTGEDRSIDRAADVFSAAMTRSMSRMAGAVPGGSLVARAGAAAGVGGGVLPIVAALGIGVLALRKAISTLKEWDRTLLNQAQSLARFSGPLASSLAQARFSTIRRSIRSGSGLGETLGRGVDLRQTLLDELRPISDTATFIKSELFNSMTENLVEIVQTTKHGFRFLMMTNPPGDVLRRYASPLNPFAAMIHASADALDKIAKKVFDIHEDMKDRPSADFTDINQKRLRMLEQIKGSPIDTTRPGAL